MDDNEVGWVLLSCSSCDVRVSVPAAPRTAGPAIRTFFGIHAACRTSIDLHDAHRDVHELLPGPVRVRAV